MGHGCGLAAKVVIVLAARGYNGWVVYYVGGTGELRQSCLSIVLAMWR
jgi:hypothetical protein